MLRSQQTFHKNVLLILTIALVVVRSTYSERTTNSPLIGILAMPVPSADSILTFGNYNWVYVLKSYTDWVEQAGGIPILVPFDLEPERRDIVLSSL